MARSYPNNLANGAGNLPPPSTLAAQIVQNQTKSVVSHQSGQQSELTSLLHEILHNPTIEVERNLETNVQLVKVLVDAGISVLSKEQPFASDILIKQAKDSISVIESTITRQPEVLATSLQHEGPPLCLWLIVRIANIAASVNAETVPLERLLGSIITALSHSTKLWRTAKAFKNVLRDCIEDILRTLEKYAPGSRPDIMIPPARSLTKLWHKAEGLLVTSHECQAQIHEPSHAAHFALRILRCSYACQEKYEDTSIALLQSAIRLRKYRIYAKSWDCFLAQMVKAKPASKNLAMIWRISDLLSMKQRPTTELQKALAQAYRELSSIANKDHALHALLQTLARVKASDAHYALDDDLKEAMSSLVEKVSSLPVSADVTPRTSSIQQDTNLSDVGSNKRRKLDIGNEQRKPIRSQILRFFSAEETAGYEEFADRARLAYAGFDETKQCIAWRHLAQLVKFDISAATAAISSLSSTPSLQTNRKAKIFALRAVQTCASKTTDRRELSLNSSAFGKACLRGLQSSSRELRIAAGSCLPAFLRHNIDSDLRKENCRLALQYLRRLADHNSLGVQETLVPTWGRIARVVDKDELNLVLLRLVDYLGHSNTLIRGLAFSELQITAAERQDAPSAEAMLAPYWSSIAVSVARDLITCPQKAQMLSDLIGKDVNTFLTMTQLHTIPTMVVTKRKDVLKRIALARGAGTTTRDICIQPRSNLIAVLTHLVAQGGNDTEQFAATCLTAAHESFVGEDFADLLKIDSTAIACELLKFAGEQNGNGKSKAHDAFCALANLCERPPGQRRAHSNSNRLVKSFFTRHILGILTGYTSVIEGSSSTKSHTEKTACLKAVAEMIVLAEDKLNDALPQTRALLQSAIEQPDLCQTAWTTWLTLLPALTEDDVVAVLEQTFALILKHWGEWNDQIKKQTHTVVSELIRTHQLKIAENVMTLPRITGIPLFEKIGKQIDQLQATSKDDINSVKIQFGAFTKRLGGENGTVIFQALKDLVPYLERYQDVIHDAAVTEQPSQYLSDLVRALLDVASTLDRNNTEPAELCGRALGIIGCLDPNRIDISRKKDRLLILSNFDKADEVIRWVVILLEQYLVKAFRSVTNAQAQGFMAYVIQELLKFCGFDKTTALRPRLSQPPRAHQRWQSMPDHVQTTLSPFLDSRYTVTTSGSVSQSKRTYPSFSPDASHSAWLRGLVYDLTWKAKGDNAQMLFPHLARIVRGHDLAIANFLLPYITLNVILGATVTETESIKQEILAVLGAQGETSTQVETIKLCSESLFSVLDYMSIWLQEKRKLLTETRANAFRTGQSPADFDEVKDIGQIGTAEKFLASIPAELIADRAMECGAYARALFNWEQYIRQSRPLILSTEAPSQNEDDYHRLHEIYARIEEPDGLEGISEHLSFLSEEEQATQHSRSGRWTLAQAWYEARLTNDAGNPALQDALLGCLQETGRFSTLIKFAESFITEDSSAATNQQILSSLMHAAWMSGDMRTIKSHLKDQQYTEEDAFDTAVGKLLVSVVDKNQDNATYLLASIRRSVVLSMTPASTSSLQSSHEDLRKLHMLSEIEMINLMRKKKLDPRRFTRTLDKRLDVLGAHSADKQMILAIRRNLMQVDEKPESTKYAAAIWLAIARLARKEGNTEKAYHAVLQASELGDRAAKLEEAKLLWHDGHRRQAIAAIEQANASGIFDDLAETQPANPIASHGNTETKQNIVAAKAQLVHAKWLDRSGQTQTREMTLQYMNVTKMGRQWEKGHYHLGKHYFHLLEAEQAMPKAKQTSFLLSGELSRLVIENLLRSIAFGNKYWHETIPKILTLWLDLGMEVYKPPREDRAITDKRAKALTAVHDAIRRYIRRFPQYIFYTAMPQMLSRLSHPHMDVWRELSSIIGQIVQTYPAQALWTVMAVTRATDPIRQARGKEIISKLKPTDHTKGRPDADVRLLVVSGEKLSEGLLKASEAPVADRLTGCKLKDLHFNKHQFVPCHLVVPMETTLSVNLAPTSDQQKIRSYKPFVQDKVTIANFNDDVLVLSSLQRPKKLTLVGSDGKAYGLLCKPKDDLRKDQRLMEFNGIINRALKRDPEGSRRRLYIKTYAVTPLSEESGCLEWVEGIKPIRDILLNLYNRRSIRPFYNEIRNELNEACKSPDNLHIWDQVQARFPAVLHEWFAEVYAEPETWFAARLRYARSTAVMSMTGHVLGLGDRHGENILLQESTGGVFHVDFNCLFDKGLTFEKPEVVPFRLTRNMVDAMGPYGHEGPFRKSCEVTLGLLRQNKDTLMTILETFLYDPTTDFVGKKKKSLPGVPDTPREILENVEAKLRGLFRGETMPLSVEGYVDALIREAVSSWNLCHMYIGWCAFL